MGEMNRREFVKSASASIFAGPAFIRSQRTPVRMPIAFSTLGCPGWEWKKILEEASRNGYSALELRGILSEMDLPKSPQFTGDRLKESLKDLDAFGIRISDLGASARLGEPDDSRRAAQLDEARRFIDLAHRLKSPYVRVFGGKLAAGQSMESATARIIDGFRSLHDHAKGSGVTLIIESHDEFTTSHSLLGILKAVDPATAALLWDAHHTVVAGNEKPADTWKQLGKYVRHTHLKDSRPAENGRRYVLTGDGEVPVRETVRVLAKAGYRGYYCFEWEKRWHPEIEEPEIAIPHFAKVMKEYLAGA